MKIIEGMVEVNQQKLRFENDNNGFYVAMNHQGQWAIFNTDDKEIDSFQLLCDALYLLSMC